MEQTLYYLGLVFFSVVVGLLGIFYRNILKMPNMIFSPVYSAFKKMVAKGGFLKFIAYPLGYCIYCATTWIGILGFLLVYKRVSLDILVVIGLSNYVVMYFCKHYSSVEGFAHVEDVPDAWDTDDDIAREAVAAWEAYNVPMASEKNEAVKAHEDTLKKEFDERISLGLNRHDYLVFKQHMRGVK